MAKTAEESDHVDRFLAETDLPGVDLEVEGIVDRINGLRRRFTAMADETLAELALAEGEWKVLTNLRFAGPPYLRPAGKLAKRAELSNEALIAAALNETEKRQLNALLRRLMREFERREEARS